MYLLVKSKKFEKKARQLVSKDERLRSKLLKALKKLHQNPFDTNLKTHKVQSRLYGMKYASKVSKDVRIIWDFSQDKQIRILLLDIGPHSGNKRVYK